MKRFILLCIYIISSVVVFAQLKKGSEYIYFYKEIDKPNIIACYFSANKVYFQDWSWKTFEARPYSFFRKKLLEHNEYVHTAYFQSNKSNSMRKIYLWYINGYPYNITFEDDMKTLVDDRAGGCIYKIIEKENDTLNNDVIYE